MVRSLTSRINRKIERLLNYPGCGVVEFNSRKSIWAATMFGFVHVLILTFSFLFFVPDLTILIRYGFACLILLTIALIVIPYTTRHFRHYITIHLTGMVLVTFYTISLLGGIATSAGLIVACLSFVLLSIPLQSIPITILLFTIYFFLTAVIGLMHPYLTIPDQITPSRNAIIWMINTLSMSALSLLFVVDFITKQHRFEQLEANKQKEINEVKSKLFTNITHEFRTPLTIIQGMTDLIRKRPEEWLEQGTEKIRNNSFILLRLINQMLDIAKIDSGSMSKQMKQADIMSFVGYVTELFRSVASDRKIELHYIRNENPFYMDFDPEKIVHIISNLLSNAFKFTPAGGNVTVKAELFNAKNHLVIGVTDTGIGIQPQHLVRIFDRFYQVGNNAVSRGGTGLGLALTKEMVEILNGRIWVESQPGIGSSFFIELPVTKEAPLSLHENLTELLSDISKSVLTGVSPSTLSPEKKPLFMDHFPTVVIVEDSQDVALYLEAILKQEYHVEKASDGKAGFEKILQVIPDIVLSDVMMPEMDGIEMLEKLKSDFRTSHIPVVLLTAKADLDSRLTGLARGADAYIAKPFHEIELLIQLKNLIDQRKKLQERYSSLAEFPETSDESIKAEDSFMIRVRNILEKNLGNDEFDIHDLCRELAVSHAQLYRKFKSLSNYTIADYFKLLRLHKSRELLTKSDLNITQIAFTVGFKNLSYFSREFTEHFGISPGKFRKQEFK